MFKRYLYFLFLLLSYLQSMAQPADYYSTIQPIIQKHCGSCHNGDGVGAMALRNYKEVKAYAKMIQYVTENNFMPPWKADAGYSHLKNYNSLSENEITAIKNWVNNGMPEGKSQVQSKQISLDRPEAVVVPVVTLAMENSFTIQGDYKETSQVFVIPSGFDKDKIIDAIEFVPGNRKIVKSCSVSLDTGQTGNQYDRNDLDYGYTSLAGLGFIPYQYNWYQWTADAQPGFYMLPAPKKIPAGSKLLLHITYVATKNIQADSSYVKLRLQQNHTGPDNFIRSEILFDTTHITNGPFTVNQNEKRKFYATAQIKKGIEIHSVMPMGQYSLSSWEIYAIDSLTGIQHEIVRIPHWDAHWKKKYILEKPVQLSPGSKVFGIAYYNNSPDNPNLIILPAKKIKYGEGQRDELFIVQFDIVDRQK